MSTSSLTKPAGFDLGGGLSQGAAINLNAPKGGAQQAKTGLRILLAVITSLFLLFILSFMMRSQYADWQPLSGKWQPLADPWLLWLNTAMLVLSSIALQWARMVARKGESISTLISFTLGGVFSVLFLLGQLWLWQRFIGWGYFVATNPANSFFYLLTGLHGLHIVGGVSAWAKTAIKLWRRFLSSGEKYNSSELPADLRTSIGLCAVYNHYLLAVWFVLFSLLVSTPDAYRAFAEFCGFAV